MLQFDPGTGLLSLPIWVSATAAAVMVVLAILAFARSGAFKTLFALLALGLVVYGGWMGWLMFERLGNSERVDERRAFDLRVTELLGRATAPGSLLSCLDNFAVEALATGCEKVVFESPENVAATVAFIQARLSLLIDGLAAAAQSEVSYDNALNHLRRGLETDRFGIVAYVMAQQPNCLPQQCESLSLLGDANTVRVNLQEKPFEALIAKYAPQWTQPARVNGSADAGRAPIGAAPPAPVSSRYELPSAASIPPVSIMNSETGQTPTATAPAAAPTAMPPGAPGVATPAPRRPPAVRAPVARSAAPPEPVPLAPTAAAPTPPGTPSAPAAR